MLGWIGTGVMGKSMAGHLQAAGHDLYIFNRTKSKAETLLQKGAQWCESPPYVAKHAEIIAVQAQGHGHLGTQALMLALKALNGDT